MKEIWKDVEGFEGKYQVSNMGRIKSLDYNNKGKPALRTPVKDKKGKMQINFWKGNKAYPKTVARVVFETFSGKRLRKNQLIKYFDGNSKNCSFENLYTESKVKKVKVTKYIRNLKDELWRDIPRL